MIIQADARNIPLDDESVNCCVTSPPYWGLRDYGVDGQIGLEESIDDYVGTMVDVFREVKRVLRKDGVAFLNLGDSYASSTKGSGGRGVSSAKQTTQPGAYHSTGRKFNAGIPPKSLCGIPWRVALALQADGWILRSDIIWHKPNPMPESVRDRPTKAHEYVFLLAKSTRYWWGKDAVKERSVDPSSHRPRTPRSADKREGDPLFATKVGNHAVGKVYPTRNARTVQSFTTTPYKGAHFACMPIALADWCIRAGCPADGVGRLVYPRRVSRRWRCVRPVHRGGHDMACSEAPRQAVRGHRVKSGILSTG